MKVYFGSDHHGDELRPRLVSCVNRLGYESEDLGVNTDYPIIAQRVVERVLKHRNSVGILICATGQGMSIAANRYSGIRAAVCNTVADARHAREHTDANILALGADRVKGPLAKRIAETFLSTAFVEEERHKRRIRQMGSMP